MRQKEGEWILCRLPTDLQNVVLKFLFICDNCDKYCIGRPCRYVGPKLLCKQCCNIQIGIFTWNWMCISNFRLCPPIFPQIPDDTIEFPDSE